METSPRRAGFRQPAEWERHRGCWVALPYRPEEWPEGVGAAQQEFGALCRALATGKRDRGRAATERLEVLVPDARGERIARRLVGRATSRLHRMRYGDSWTRDTGPVFLRHEDGTLGAACFRFNGWGGRYRIPGDEGLGVRIARRSGARCWSFDVVVEGGAIDVDGEGTAIASRTCLLHPNRNPGLDPEAMERLLCEALGLERVLWIDGALANDHTDGHTDTLARFVAPGIVTCMEPRGRDDPNGDTLRHVARTLAGALDARRRRIRIVPLPSPGAVRDGRGHLLPASYCNFYISNDVVAVPAYDRPQDPEAAERLAAWFPGRRAVGLRARATLTGGGGWHCMTQPQPAVGTAPEPGPDRSDAGRNP